MSWLLAPLLVAAAALCELLRGGEEGIARSCAAEAAKPPAEKDDYGDDVVEKEAGQGGHRAIQEACWARAV